MVVQRGRALMEQVGKVEAVALKVTTAAVWAEQTVLLLNPPMEPSVSSGEPVVHTPTTQEMCDALR